LFNRITNRFFLSTPAILGIFNKNKKKTDEEGAFCWFACLLLRRVIEIKAIPIIALLLISLFLPVAGAAGTIQVQNVQVDKIGNTATVNLILDTSPAGVAGYDITVSLSNPSVATITRVSLPSWALLNESTTFPASSVRLRTLDLYEQVDPGATNVPFGTITLKGKAVGSTDVVVTIKNITSDDGNSFTPAVQSGKFTAGSGSSQPVIANHTKTHLSQIPKAALDQARSNLHIAYQHTSHGSQVTDGMTGLMSFTNAPYGSSTYLWSDGVSAGALDLDDYFASGDLGSSDWAQQTRDYLDDPTNSDVNVVMWSWCGQVSGATEDSINTYLSQMNQLEADYPNVKFVYMTGHLDGGGADGNLNQRNEQIRAYARANNKILYDFADIESFDPDGITNFMLLNADDNCTYNNDVNYNWAVDWQNLHVEGVDWYDCSAAHSQPLNGNQKAYAAWWLWARLAGWDGDVTSKIGTFRDGAWYVDYSGNHKYDGAVTDRQYNFGSSGALPVVGDWNDDGRDEIGTFRNGAWYVDYNRNHKWDGSGTDRQYNFGSSGALPVVGDWNDDGKDEIGTFRNGAWYVDYNRNHKWDGTGTDRQYNFGSSGALPVVGDWNDDGKDEIGTFRDGAWYVDYNGNHAWDGSGTDRQYSFGSSGALPVVGDWNNDGKDEIGTFRDGAWYVDYNGNHKYDGSGTDRQYNFGSSGATPVTGKWN
jgi:hypothetical protein